MAAFLCHLSFVPVPVSPSCISACRSCHLGLCQQSACEVQTCKKSAYSRLHLPHLLHPTGQAAAAIASSTRQTAKVRQVGSIQMSKLAAAQRQPELSLGQRQSSTDNSSRPLQHRHSLTILHNTNHCLVVRRCHLQRCRHCEVHWCTASEAFRIWCGA